MSLQLKRSVNEEGFCTTITLRGAFVTESLLKAPPSSMLRAFKLQQMERSTVPTISYVREKGVGQAVRPGSSKSQ